MRQLGSIPVLIAAVTAAIAACSKSVDPPPPVQSAAARSTTAPADPASDKPHHRGHEDDHGGKHEDRHDPAVAAPQLQLTVAIHGAASTWQKDAFDKVARYAKNDKARDGEAREVWSMRDLAHDLVGPGARVTAVTGDGGSKSIDRAAWDDASREPLLHTTRRGTLKFRWASADGTWGDTEVKDVTRIEIAP
jgi:hypothetical protein